MTVRSVITTMLLALSATLLARMIAPALTFNLWDNFETFTPQALFAHRAWLGLHLPLLNLRQSLGVSPLGIGDNGVLYAPYTVLLVIARAFGSEQLLPELIGTFHVSLALAGWCAFARRLGVREGLALLFAAGVTGSGYFLLGSAIWHFIGVTYAWFPWILIGLKGVIETGSMRALALFVTSWTLCAWGSHAQQLTYLGLHSGLLALLFAWPRRGEARTWIRLASLGATMVATALPAFVYGLPTRAASARAAAVSSEEFFQFPFRANEILALFTPSARVKEGYLGCASTWLLFAGSWVVPGLLFVRRIPSRATTLALGAIAVVFLDFSAGPAGFVYPLTRTLPIWSSFRYVYKFAPHVTISLGLLALLGLDAGWTGASRRTRAFVYAFVVAAPFLRLPAAPSFAALAASHALGAVFALSEFGSRRPWWIRAAAVAMLATSLWVASDVSLHRYEEKYGEYGVKYFGLEAPERSRLATLSLARCAGGTGCAMQPLAQFDAATVNDYFALAGHQMGLTPRAFAENVTANVWGVIPPSARGTVGSSLFRALAVRYYLLSETDWPTFAPSLEAKGLREHRRGEGWRVFEDSLARDLVVIPDAVVTAPNDDLDPALRADDAFVVARARGLGATMRPENTRVESTWWIEGRGLGFDVENRSAEDSFAVASLFPWPYLEVEMDRAPVPFFPTNGLTTGVRVPPGRHRVEIRASARPLFRALACALATLALGAFVIRRTGPARR